VCSEACTAINICRNCQPGQGCFAVQNPKQYHVTQHGQVANETNMMAEIYARGPIACTIAVTQAFEVRGVFGFSDAALAPAHRWRCLLVAGVHIGSFRGQGKFVVISSLPAAELNLHFVCAQTGAVSLDHEIEIAGTLSR
jgi:hypothetical protein